MSHITVMQLRNLHAWLHTNEKANVSRTIPEVHEFSDCTFPDEILTLKEEGDRKLNLQEQEIIRKPWNRQESPENLDFDLKEEFNWFD